MTADWESRHFQDERLETFPRSICKILSEIRYSQHQSFCIPDVSSGPNLHGLEVISGKSGNKRHVSTMGKNVPVCLSPIQTNTPVIVKTKERKDHNDIGGTNTVITSIMFSSSEHVYPQSTFIATSKGSTSGHITKNLSFSSKPDSNTGSLVGFRKPLSPKGTSNKASKLISGSRKESLISSHESVWRQWDGFC